MTKCLSVNSVDGTGGFIVPIKDAKIIRAKVYFKTGQNGWLNQMTPEQKEKLWELIDELLDAEFIMDRTHGCDSDWHHVLEDAKQKRINLQVFIKEV